MTPLERVCVCGAIYRIETDDLKYADKKAKAFEKQHSKCRPIKPKESLTGHPRTKKWHIKGVK